MNLSPQAIDALLHQISPVAAAAATGLGTVMPLVVSFISSPRFTKRQKAILSVVSCVAASAIVCLATGAFTGLNWFVSLFILLQVTWQFYARLYKPVGVSDWFEQMTTFSKLGSLFAGMLGSAAASVLSATQRYTDGIEAPNDNSATSTGGNTNDLPHSSAVTGDGFK